MTLFKVYKGHKGHQVCKGISIKTNSLTLQTLVFHTYKQNWVAD